MADDVLELLHDASQRLVRAIDAMADEAWPAPSLLPGWSRAHVVAHLTLNAEALTGAVDGVRDGRPVPMYPSQAQRDADIEDLVPAGPSVLRDRLMGSTTRMAAALRHLPEDLAAATIERVPGGPTFRAGQVGAMRLCEVEIHLVDLDVGAVRSTWSPGFTRLLVDRLTDGGTTTPGSVLAPTDLDVTWRLGDGSVEVTGTAADLGWWLSGRGSGEGLHCDAGALPEI